MQTTFGVFVILLSIEYATHLQQCGTREKVLRHKKCVHVYVIGRSLVVYVLD